MSALTRAAIAFAITCAVLLPPGTSASYANDSDPNDAIQCVEDLGVKGYSVRINNRCGFALRLATCVVGSSGTNACAKGGQQELFPVPAHAKEHVILDMQVGADTSYFILACKDPWTPGNPHMKGGEFRADQCDW
jgi:hypothetical protein